MLFDAHTHINFEEYTDEEREALAREIASSDLSYVVDAGNSVESSVQAVKDSIVYPWCYASVGIHPHHASTYTDADLEKIKQLAIDNRFYRGEPGCLREKTVIDVNSDTGVLGIASDNSGGKSTGASEKEDEGLNFPNNEYMPKARGKVVALGEFGLDFHYGKDNKDAQIELFRKQIRMSNELKMPMMIHTREADQLTMDILVEEGAFSEERKSWFRPRMMSISSLTGVDIPDAKEAYDSSGTRMPDFVVVSDARVQLHCYSGSAELAKEYVKLGAMFSIGGPVTFKNGRRAVEVVDQIPFQFIMSETDAPYLTPEPFRGRPNKSPYIEHIVRRMALIKGIDYEAAAAILMSNGRHFFGI